MTEHLGRPPNGPKKRNDFPDNTSGGGGGKRKGPKSLSKKRVCATAGRLCDAKDLGKEKKSNQGEGTEKEGPGKRGEN